jgi:NAD(P)-dependent dehydrogenase (short-subunit alcohol dehydrogenase family)
MSTVSDLFSLAGKVAMITGGAGLMGRQHAEIIAQAGGIPVLIDLPAAQPVQAAAALGGKAMGCVADITQAKDLEAVKQQLLARFSRIDILINNAAHNPKAEDGGAAFTRLENFPMKTWQSDLEVGLTGAFLCSQVFGSEMARRGGGVIVNIASDLSLISPDQRLYRRDDLPEDQQPVKPVTYSVVKSGLLGLTRYLATYWARQGVRVNAISPGGIQNGQDDLFVQRVSELIPLGRMARYNEYQGAILFLCSDASSYMTGANLVIDGGRTCW